MGGGGQGEGNLQEISAFLELSNSAPVGREAAMRIREQAEERGAGGGHLQSA